MYNKKEGMIRIMRNERKFKFIYLTIMFIIMLFWAVKQPYDYAPDEYMRYKVPEYIYNHGKLPLPDDKEVVVKEFNASYAYYPTLLPAITSSVFMKLTSLITKNDTALLVAARLTSVLSGVIFIYFMMRIFDELIKDKKIKYLGIFLSSLIPQFVFLSSYVNNDSCAIMASSIIVYSWIKGLNDGWNFKNSITLSIGIIICALSYYNAYGWILLSVIIFIISFIKKSDEKITIDYKPLLKYGTFISIVVLVFVSYFFVRSYIVNNGDLLGIDSFLDACEEGGADYLKPSLRNTPQNLKMSYLEMLTTTRYGNSIWPITTYISFIGNFGYMKYKLPVLIYLGYTIIIGIGLIGYFKRIKDIIKDKKSLFFNLALISCIIIPIVLSIKYSYSTDYQPQGRYIYPMFTGFIIIITLGFEKLNNLIKFKHKNKIINMIALFIIISFIIASKVFINSI